MANGDKIPAKMTAVAISQPGGPLVLKPEKRDVPEPGEGEILIRVRAAGVNRPDVQQRKGAYPPPPGASDLPGLEVSGEVVAVGEGARRWRLGDAVCALTPGGGYAEYAKVHESNALPVPQGFTLTEAAALPETFFTVWHNVFERGGLKAGETLLVHGGSSGIGTTAIQLASALGAYVITTAGSAEKCEACLKLGADRVVNYREQDFVAAVKEATDGRGANVILDMVGGDYVGRNYNAAAVEGRIVQIATQGGAVASADFAKLMVKRLVHTGSTLRPRTVEFKGQLAAALEAQVWPLLAARRVVPVMDMIFPLREAWRAHERMEEGEHIGKIVLDVA
ncbi:NAD(P)H-quinone oxidoreductase [Allomesorhizobium alhagi]|jgi:putative PIG3 family NAD(P)H quinone oxidoreductase|uniref:NAD(P)H quinone oxidoreductase, PIG3 family protein n=1 Tax=Mesorhizobium alhagi CCNWXJ12-2 TaxID=1107882 RepID=H0HM37_9HYPH|nr:NAD(P)H-quinone oxidoreductase [Mesorhizobium alhagi]EHK58229.1 NAD(P)H quinone oxidoreductase, PIG3 family protein [Mesorhizobium alhagi CCNWXJ12-2]